MGRGEELGVAKFLLGVNYWPRRSAMYMWQRFDLGEIREDLARMRELGLQAVRFFLSWEAFQPQADLIDRAALGRLDGLLDAVAGAGLRAIPTFFTGHMSGVNWLPEWTLDSAMPHGRFRTYCAGAERPYGIGDMYVGPLLVAQRLQVRTVGERCRDHPAIYAWDLGNEFSNLREPRTPADAAQWSETLAHDLLETSGIACSAGTHGEDITFDRNIRPSSLCRPFAFATMHGYSVYSAFARGRLDSGVVPFLCRVMQSCAGTPVLFGEFGNPTCPPGAVRPGASSFACLSEDEMAVYGYAVLDALQRQGALGGLWWCWADYAGEITDLAPFDRAPHELTFGIVRGDGSEKPVARMLARFAREERGVTALPPPILDEPTYFAGLPGAVESAYRAYLETDG